MMKLGWNIERTVKTCVFENACAVEAISPFLAGVWENLANKCTNRNGTPLILGESDACPPRTTKIMKDNLFENVHAFSSARQQFDQTGTPTQRPARPEPLKPLSLGD
jgi:hypothetical protein